MSLCELVRPLQTALLPILDIVRRVENIVNDVRELKNLEVQRTQILSDSYVYLNEEIVRNTKNELNRYLDEQVGYR